MKPDYILFTDGSSITEPGKRMQYAAYAFLVINNHTKKSTKKADIIDSGDSARTEAFAIYYGLKYLNSLVKTGTSKTVLVLSDSKYMISLIEKHLLRWYNGEKIRTKATDRLNADKAMFRNLAKIMSGNKLDITFVHVKAHLTIGARGELQDRIKSAGYIVSKTTAANIIRFNRIVDKAAKTESKKLATACGHYNPDGYIRLIEKDTDY